VEQVVVQELVVALVHLAHQVLQEVLVQVEHLVHLVHQVLQEVLVLVEHLAHLVLQEHLD